MKKMSVCVQTRLLVPMVVPVLMAMVHCTAVPVLMGILESTVTSDVSVCNKEDPCSNMWHCVSMVLVLIIIALA